MYKKILKILKVFVFSGMLFTFGKAEEITPDLNNLADLEMALDQEQATDNEKQESKLSQLWNLLSNTDLTWESKYIILSEVLKDHVSENKKKYILGAVTVGTAGAGLLAYLIYNKCNKDDKK
ncbi:MAG: hypothetical protein SZ59_C0003G0021 [candidate division TM6 bacterium GW2011_GWF2_28_16]|nr:MAG: hypothetical protein SZ59_C0003G0021 [candidate division TM6 bacterium GW2011_GWF2_28_16]